MLKKMLKELLENIFDAEFDIKYLCSGKKEKILKKDIDLELDELNKYKLICPIGAESLKYTAGLTGVQKYNGVFVEKDTYL